MTGLYIYIFLRESHVSTANQRIATLILIERMIYFIIISMFTYTHIFKRIRTANVIVNMQLLLASNGSNIFFLYSLL